MDILSWEVTVPYTYLPPFSIRVNSEGKKNCSFKSKLFPVRNRPHSGSAILVIGHKMVLLWKDGGKNGDGSIHLKSCTE